MGQSRKSTGILPVWRLFLIQTSCVPRTDLLERLLDHPRTPYFLTAFVVGMPSTYRNHLQSFTTICKFFSTTSAELTFSYATIPRARVIKPETQ